MQDDRTTNLNLPKPSAANILTDDVARVRSALDLIDAAIATKATAADVTAALSNLVGSAPAVLDTLAELATALNNDPSFAAHTATSIASLQAAVATLQAGMSTYYTRQKWTLTAGQTSINTSGYIVGFVQLYLNGVLLVDGDDYTATNGNLITLATGAAAGDSIEAIMLHPFQLVNTTFTGKTTIEGQLDMPQWTTATRPASPRYGTTGYNTETKALENYTDQGWLKVSVPIPIITSSSGTIYSGITSTITLSGINFGTGTATVTFTSGATSATATATPTNGGQTCAVTVPAAIYGLAAGSSVEITLKNADNASSGAITKASLGIPSGGTVTTAGSYRIHTFASSGNFVVPTGFSANAEYLIAAGGGAGGDYFSGSGYNAAAGGGGAGGLITNVGSAIVLTSGSYSAVVGAAGVSTATNNNSGGFASNGSNSSFNGLTAIGGGRGGAGNASVSGNGYGANSGGSGGGGVRDGFVSAGSGTSGQGRSGGSYAGTTDGNGGGGGGYSTAGTVAGDGGYGGSGVTSSISGADVIYCAGGGGGKGNNGTWSSANGGSGVGGNGATKANNAVGGNASSYGCGGGGAGSAIDASSPFARGGNGSQGIVIIRYPIPT